MFVPNFLHRVLVMFVETTEFTKRLNILLSMIAYKCKWEGGRVMVFIMDRLTKWQLSHLHSTAIKQKYPRIVEACNLQAVRYLRLARSCRDTKRRFWGKLRFPALLFFDYCCCCCSCCCFVGFLGSLPPRFSLLALDPDIPSNMKSRHGCLNVEVVSFYFDNS